MKLNWNFQRGCGYKPKNSPWGESGYFLEQHIALPLVKDLFVRVHG